VRAARRSSPARGLRLLLLATGTILWTLLACYPDPAVLARNLARYRRFPIDREIEQEMGWELPSDPNTIELFVDSLLVPTPDWAQYRVPWYVPTAREAALSLHGDCEAKAVLFASLLAGKDLPFDIRASFTHIWVDYPGRPHRPGETERLAYLQGEPGRFRLRWPEVVSWGDFLSVQRAQLWDVMPLARKAIWLLGLLWVGLAAVLLGGPAPVGELHSLWRVRGRNYLAFAAYLAFLVFVGIALAPNLRPGGGTARWTLADLREIVVLSALAGAFLAWVTTVRPRRAVAAEEGGSRLHVSESLGVWRKSSTLAAEEIAHFELNASPGGLKPWVVSAALRTGERLPLLRHRSEVRARQALRSLGRSLDRPVLVRSDGREYWTMPDEITLNLRQRAARRPPAPLPEKPRSCLIHVEQSGTRRMLGNPTPEGRSGLALLGFAAVPAIFVLLATQALVHFPKYAVVWFVWLLSMSLLSLVIYLAVILRGEIVGVLAGARVEIGEGELRFHSPEGKVESLPVDEVESIEHAREGHAAIIAVVSPNRVIHLRGLCAAEHRDWVCAALAEAIRLSPTGDRSGA